MLADFTDLARRAFAIAVQDQKTAHDARSRDRAAIQSALAAAQAQLDASNEDLRKPLVAAAAALEQEQKDDERVAELLSRALPAVLNKLGELNQL